MDDRSRLAARSRDSHLALRRVERQQWLVERLVAAGGARVPLEVLASQLSVSTRTVARDVQRLASSGVPVTSSPGRQGGISLAVGTRVRPVSFDLAETAALLASLAALGPTATESSAAAMRKLVASVASLPAPPAS